MLNDLCFRLSQAQDIIRVAQENEIARPSLLIGAREILREAIRILEKTEIEEEE